MPSPNGHLPAAIYRRVSTERQAERVSPEAQLTDCETYARENGLTIVAVYSDLEKYRVRGRLVEPSGTRTDRPAFQQMLADARAHKFKAIIAWKEDRLYRSVQGAVLVDELMRDTGLGIHLVKEMFDRKMVFVKAAIGRIENENRAERTAMGMLGRAQKGLHHGGKVPHGYVAVKDRLGATIGYELDPAWRWFFDELAIRFLRREPYHAIASALGNSTRTGLPWAPNTIRFFVRNPFYKGQVVANWLRGQPDFTGRGVQPAAWDADTCAAIEREYQRRSKAGKNAPRGAGLFSGIVRCGICGGLMATCRTHPYTLTDGTVKQYRAYGCYRPIWVRQGTWLGETHENNFINELKLLGLVRATVGQLSVADVDNYLQSLVGANITLTSDLERHGRLQADADALAGKLADLTVGLEGVRNASPAAAEAIIAEMTRVGRKLDGLREELRTLSQTRAAAPDLSLARRAMLQLIEAPELFDRPSGELKPYLHHAFPALFIRGGGLAPPVEAWPAQNRKGPATG